MQPYLFPYIGYFQLIASVDKFVILDDVNFIKGGWVNRNKLYINDQVHLFTMPISKVSQNRLISETIISDSYKIWSIKFMKTLERAYRKAPFYNKVYELIKSVLNYNTKSLCEFISNSIHQICNYLKVSTTLSLSSGIYQNKHLNGAQRIIDICKKENAKFYLNPLGGQNLYNVEEFANKGIKLNFLKPLLKLNDKNDNKPTAHLSIIDVLMFNSPNEINKLLKQYSLEQ